MLRLGNKGNNMNLERYAPKNKEPESLIVLFGELIGHLLVLAAYLAIPVLIVCFLIKMVF